MMLLFFDDVIYASFFVHVDVGRPRDYIPCASVGLLYSCPCGGIGVGCNHRPHSPTLNMGLHKPSGLNRYLCQSVFIATFRCVRHLLRGCPPVITHSQSCVPAVFTSPGFHGTGHARLQVQRAILLHLSDLVARHRSLHRCAAASAAPQQAQEGVSEVRVERIDDRVEGRIAPADPHEDIESFFTDTVRAPLASRGLWSGTEGHSAVQDKEWQPAADKNAYNNAQSFEDFCLFSDGDFKRPVRLIRVPRIRMKADMRLVRVGTNVRAQVSELFVYIRAATLCVLRRPLQGGYHPDLHLCYPVDTGVCNNHDGHRDVETDEGGGDGVRAA